MLGDFDAIATLAVSDMPKAVAFYETTLGLMPVAREGDEFVTYRSGSSVFNVYRSDHAGSNRATAAAWVVAGQLEEVVAALRAKGLAFEHYELPGLTLRGDVHVGDHVKMAWFKDPDGNILHLIGH